MTAGPIRPLTPERLFRNHLTEMREYADEIAATVGVDSAIVKRIRHCAKSNEDILNVMCPPKCGECGRPKGGAA